MIAANGWEKTLAEFEAGTAKVTTLASVKAGPKAVRVAGFIVTWAIAMREEGRDEYTITDYQRRWAGGERQAYRLQKEFRELWPEYQTPNELARQVVKHIDATVKGRKANKLLMAASVMA